MEPAGAKAGWSTQQWMVVFTACVFFLLMPADFYTSRQRALQSNSRPLGTVKQMNAPHPIPVLMAEAEERYRNLLATQSKTLVEAVNEYRRRYGREPPRGFGDWWQFAVEHNATMVDEYDGMVEDLAPFWEMPGEELRRRALRVGHLPSVDLVRMKDGKAVLVNIEKDYVDEEVSARAKGFVAMTRKFQSKLPDMDFPINTKAEGRVLVPWEHRHFTNMTGQSASVGVDSGEFTPDWQGVGSVWEAFRLTCPPDSRARRTTPDNNVNSTDLPSEPADDFHFSKTLDNKFDFCSNPSAHYNHGHFFSDWRTIPALYPIFSNGKAPGYSDILFPSHYYYNPTAQYSYAWDDVKKVAKEFDDMEIPWHHKNNTIFWRGATTGGGNTPGGFADRYQRHRFVRLASDHSDTRRAIVFSDPPNSTSYQQANVSITKLNGEIMDVGFTKSTGFGNYPGGEAAMRKVHRFADSVPFGYNWKYKHLVDLDGMGYSARFLAFLASDSAVIKSTVYSEYYSDWIQPWLHFIPLSQGYHEIYNLYSFFSGPTESMLQAANSSALYDDSITRRAEDGDRRLRQIAQAGKQWKQTVGRTIDMEVYVYRLCLEWGRLWADDRHSMNYTMSGPS
ncbi:glycosyltransferase family 90 protein [Rickenella mellea]|uniref:Glycosyltransferase family 90 protein n=1 Tax=Rickenella mellea TaxID=50990 RepID=A0A4Y7PIC3_9AGAM|nr:glycosyltransferase family 90 protein [Rickenella mellea]